MEIILGVFVSSLAQWLKNYLGTSSAGSMALVGILCLSAAGVYTGLVAAGYWETVAHVLVIAGAFYTFVIQRFE